MQTLRVIRVVRTRTRSYRTSSVRATGVHFTWRNTISSVASCPPRLHCEHIIAFVRSRWHASWGGRIDRLCDVVYTWREGGSVTRTWVSRPRPRTWRPRTALDHGVRENIKLRKSNSTVAQVHVINTLLNSAKGSKLSKLSSWQSHRALTAFMS